MMPPRTPNETGGGVREPLAADLFCGLGGWTEGLLSEGWRVRGYDIEEHVYGDERYPGEFVLRDVLTIHGSELADVDLIVASPPCQEYSYMAMPWGLAKAKAARIRADETGAELERLNALFNACFRIQREACAAAGRYIPMVVENVKGAQPWVGRAHWHFGSYYLWGDIPALMPIQKYHERLKVKAGEQWNVNRANFTGTRGWDEGIKRPGMNWSGSEKPGYKAGAFNDLRHAEGIKNKDADGYERSHPNAFGWKSPRTTSKGSARKASAAIVAKIPFALSSHIARVYRPVREAA